MFFAHSGIMRGLLVLIAAGTMLLAQTALGAISVSGYNEFLQDAEGKAYIPMKPATSGMLGESLGTREVGEKPDTITLNQKGASSMGSLSYELFFDLLDNTSPSGEPVLYAPENVDVSTMDLFLDLVDIDFLPVTGAGRIYLEMMTLTLSGIGECPYYTDGPAPSLTIDMNNYTDFGPDGLTETNNAAVTYRINMQDDLGLSQDDFDQILDSMTFSLMVTVSSYTERTAPGSGTYVNTLEYLGDYSAGTEDNGFSGPDGIPVNALLFDVIPEPMTLALLGAGSIVLLRRRKTAAA